MREWTGRRGSSVSCARHASSLLAPASGGLVAALLETCDWPAAWTKYHAHDHQLHTMPAMRAAIAARYSSDTQRELPYLYRYLIPLLPKARVAAAFVAEVFNDERR